MALKSFRPITPSLRQRTILVRNLSKVEPEKRLLKRLQYRAGRNHQGRITIRHKGGRAKRLYRIIDFKRDKINIEGKVVSIEYDPYRNCNIAKVQYVDGEKRYILAPLGLEVGDKVISSENAEIKVGNTLPLKNIPVGTIIHNIELKPKKGGQLVRSAGGAAQLLAKEGDYAHIRLPSSEIRLVHLECKATIGQLSNLDYKNISYGKAGIKRHLGVRPAVRGVAQNPVDHPLGGGEGKTGGGRPPVSPWGKCAKGGKTRRKKTTDWLIIKRREKK